MGLRLGMSIELGFSFLENLNVIVQYRALVMLSTLRGCHGIHSDKNVLESWQKAETECPLHTFRKIKVRRHGVLLIKGFEKHHTSVNIPQELRKHSVNGLPQLSQFWFSEVDNSTDTMPVEEGEPRTRRHPLNKPGILLQALCAVLSPHEVFAIC